VQDEFLEKLCCSSQEKCSPADPARSENPMGAIVSQEQMQTVLGYIESGKKEGAKLLAGGNRVSVDGGKGFIIEPTISAREERMKIAQEEISAPVLAHTTFRYVDEVSNKGIAIPTVSRLQSGSRW